VEYPDDMDALAIQDNHLVGSDLLVVTISEPGATSANVYFPGSEPWYDIENKQATCGRCTKGWKLVAAPLRKTPVFQRGGSIIARKMRLRRASTLMHSDPFTFDVALDSAMGAAGSVFVDDYRTYDYTSVANTFAYFKLAFSKTSTTFTFTFTQTEGGTYSTKEWVERINVAGFAFKPASITSSTGAGVDFTYTPTTNVLTIKKPSRVLSDFSLTIKL
jgi:alpha 1,3-glucosidase